MSPIQLTKIFVLVAAVGLIVVVDTEARSIAENDQELAKQAKNVEDDIALLEDASTNMDQINLDDDDLSADEDEDQIRPIAASANQRFQAALAPNDLKTSASYHHHGHGAKGWLDMGAWTGKKGAFGWYDKHPVGGKKGK